MAYRFRRTQGIVAFLAARLDERERIADAVINACRDTRLPWPPEQAPGNGGPVLTEFLKHFSETRVLREVAAGRAILELHGRAHECSVYSRGDVDPCAWCDRPEDCSTLRAAAAVDSGHPDYRPEWAPV